MFKLSKEIGIVLFLVFFGHEMLSRFLPVYLNFGLSFSIYWPYLLWLIPLALIVLFWRGRGIWLGLIWIGGVVNWLDRVRFGSVRDYWFLPGLNVYNNIADWVIFIGFIGYLWKNKK